MSQIQNLIDRGALFVINHSAGKDSQAMTIHLKSIVPSGQLMVVHADLGRVEWPGVQEHIRETVGDLLISVVKNPNKDLLEMVERRGMWPSASTRQCTSDLKRGPIETWVRRTLKARPEFNGLVVNCMGMRAEESPSRAKKTAFKFNERNSKAGREWYDWLPIHNWTTEEVFKCIADAGQKPHWAYEKGMSRLSCCFCILACKSDLRLSAKLNPDLYRTYVNLERKIGHTFAQPRKGQPTVFLEEITGINSVHLEAAE